MRLYHTNDNFKRTTGPNKDIINTENIRGNCTYIQGNAQNLTGDVSGLRGDISGLSGDATNCFSPFNYVYIGDITAMQPNTPIAEVL
tara:strand:- start:1202 stop:1462 length:261 start_codon:yes stop_codon:yes gene_type:complete